MDFFVFNTCFFSCPLWVLLLPELKKDLLHHMLDLHGLMQITWIKHGLNMDSIICEKWFLSGVIGQWLWIQCYLLATFDHLINQSDSHWSFLVPKLHCSLTSWMPESADEMAVDGIWSSWASWGREKEAYQFWWWSVDAQTHNITIYPVTYTNWQTLSWVLFVLVTKLHKLLMSLGGITTFSKYSFLLLLLKGHTCSASVYIQQTDVSCCCHRHTLRMIKTRLVVAVCSWMWCLVTMWL